MCESTVYLKTEHGEEKLMEEVAHITVRGSTLVLAGLLGEEMTVPARIVSIDFLNHRLTIAPA